MKIQAIVGEDEYSPWKSIYHQKEIQMLQKGELFPPKNIQIDLEAWCPHDCSFCAYRNAGFNATGMQFYNPEWAPNAKLTQTNQPKGRIVPNISGIPKEVALRLPSQMAKEGIPSIEITGGGESLAYAWIVPFLEELNKYAIEIAIVTNGQLLTERIRRLLHHLKWIRFSIDAATRETYTKIHGVKGETWDLVLKNIKALMAQKPKEAVVGISYVITKENLKEISLAAKFWKEFGANNIRYTFLYDIRYDSGMKKEELIQVLSELERARKEEEGNFKVFAMTHRPDYYSNPNDDFNFCGYQFFTWAVGYNAQVYPCCIQKYYKDYAIGDLKKESLHDIIYGEKRQAYIASFNVKQCKPCWLRDKNKFIEYLAKKDPRHVNFT